MINHPIVKFLAFKVVLSLMFKLTAPQSNHIYFTVNLAIMQGMAAACFHKNCSIGSSTFTALWLSHLCQVMQSVCMELTQSNTVALALTCMQFPKMIKLN
jgi:hypothetical protein